MAPHPLLFTSCALVALGVYGILTRRNAIGILLAIELILNAASLNFILFGRWVGGVDGQAFAIFVIALAACEAAVGLAIIMGLYRTAKTVLADEVNLLKG
ncbi:MAG TPA: NADH-quinone oxidoreductase subunit NuoK [Candidatus Omnitrophica bacterium]|nr:MAG: NADH-quinone oxidoreductase subunit K [Omnitrophica WOR_2 bacterium GWA2_63_20]OGX36487.1 MAG: NADH-quinone oxidoreductase subunit K [Omnitrophica WOR_2 bacterium RIFCSPHIGHO2_02_FULL_63_39]OGX44810.1 MAG: NADH-quinone oxidoreductase subunit K [Omnitrophica WOR_2 bacterium RIFCSPLOWO2_02_FULL_63_16]OGX48041.1 MAG: NADH-quinone oxidoreductase subunit K [Omnitrophica WOR_2 bacterium RIFCSPLOWO2_12_FULL_63_16]HBH97294.1 NADH-quinone oxidoreductase subunit NuoK [Candidatus Omnitrophota bact